MKNDFVETPIEITDSLLKYENFDGEIYEPCCGKGAISERLKKEGYIVYSADKYSYGYGKKEDLFEINRKFDNIITNPPFTHQQLVKKHLLRNTKKKLCLLWYVKNLGNEVETKTSYCLKNIYVFQEKIKWKTIKLGWLFAWYVWEIGYIGNITVKRISFEDKKQQNLNII